MRLRRVLCPTDFSEFSSRALEHAAAHARWAGAELVVMHVSPFFHPPGGGAPYVPAGVPVDGATRARVLEDLRAAAEPARAAGLDPRVFLCEGDPAEEILRQAHMTGTDLVVMGTHGIRGFDRWILGSVANRVAHRARCAVLSVPRPREDAPPRASLYERILCAVELSDAQPTLEWSVALARTAHAPLTLLHVLDDLPEHEETARLAGLDWPAFRRSLEERARERLEAAASFCAAEGVDVEPALASGRPYREILERARSSRADLVVMGTHGRNPLERLFFGSTAFQVLRQSACPVLTVRIPASPPVR